MLDDNQKSALRRWYSRPESLETARHLIAAKEWLDLEEYLHMRCLVPLGNTEDLPDYLVGADGKPLLPSLNPHDDIEAWQDAIDVGWQVTESELGLSRDDVHRAIAQHQKDDWELFLDSVERRKRERGETLD